MTFNEIKAKEEARKRYNGYDEKSIIARNSFELGFLLACKMMKENKLEK